MFGRKRSEFYIYCFNIRSRHVRLSLYEHRQKHFFLVLMIVENFTYPEKE